MENPLDKPQIICHVEQSLNYSVYETRWIPCSAKFVVLGSEPRGTGVIQVYEISSGKVEVVKQVKTCQDYEIFILIFSCLFAIIKYGAL